MESRTQEERVKNISTLFRASQERFRQKEKQRQDQFHRLEQERQSLLVDRAQILGRINSTVNKAREKIPVYEKKIRSVRDKHEVRRRLLAQPYRGEVGIGSYEPWQLEDFYFVRDFVQSWIDEVLDYVVCQPFSNISLNVNQIQEELEFEQSEIDYAKAIQEVQSTILNEVCSDLAQEAASLSLTIHYQVQQTVCNMIFQGILPAEGLDEKAVNLALYSYDQMKKDRNKQHRVWRHSQKMVFIGDEGTEMPEVEEALFDGNTLSLDGTIPYNDIPDQMLTSAFKTYRESESLLWSGFSNPIYTILPLPKRYKGVSCTALSSDQSLLAVGTFQGDLAVWDISKYPPRVLKGFKRNSTVVSIQWSLDSTQILTLDQHGTVQIWSMTKGNFSIFDVKGFEPIEEGLGFTTTELKCTLSLEPQDLLFVEGNLVSINNKIVKPTTVAFHPSLSFLGHQGTIMVGLADGNILKLKFGRSKVKTGSGNMVGKNIEAELFQAHKHPVQLISFVNNGTLMATVDDHAFINLWECKDESFSGFGWFTPKASYRLDTTVKTYEPVEGNTEKVEFVDSIKGTGRIKELNRNDMIEKQKQTQTYINSLHLGRPWKTENVRNQQVHYLYAPRNVPDGGATFHSVIYYKDTKLLHRYATLLYQPIKVACTKVISCRMNSSQTKLVFLLLFDKVSPKTPHVSFVTIEVPAMKVSRNIIEVMLNEEEFRECEVNDSCGFDFSKVLDASGSEYIITNICGTVCGFSMTTGNLIMASGERGCTGCDLGKNKPTVFKTARVKVASQASILCVLFYAPKQNRVIFLHLRDKNPSVLRHQVWQHFRSLNYNKNMPNEHVWQKNQWTFDGEFAFHLECAMESLVLELVDSAVRKSEGIDDHSFSDNWKHRMLPFLRRFSTEKKSST